MNRFFGLASGTIRIRPARRGRIASAGLLVLLTWLSACEPEVGSERWCEAMRDKPRGDWTANEALDFARHCLFETEEER